MSDPPKVTVTDDAYQITLFRKGKEETFSFSRGTIIVSRTDDDFPVGGELDEEGYLYFIQCFESQEKHSFVYVTPDEADVIVQLIFEQSGENVGDY
jgi:hypothetical protein